MQPLSALETFIAVADAGSFCAAARRVALSVPAVSKSVKALETRLGVRLFHRSTRGLAITADGQTYLEQVRSPLQALQQASLDVRRGQDAIEGCLRISAPSGFGRHCILPLVPAFLASHPGMEIDLQLGDGFATPFADAAAARFDIVIRDGRAPAGNLVTREIAPMRMLVCASPDYLASHGTPQTPADLAAHNCINLRLPHSGRVLGWEFEDATTKFSVPVKGNLVVDSIEAAAWAAQQGLGLAQLGSYHCDEAVWKNQLAVVLKVYTRTQRSHWLCYPERRHLPQRVRAFADHVCDEVPKRWWFDEERR
jgi:LysR family transcriptional regulator, regulator for bpeEF and oprC